MRRAAIYLVWLVLLVPPSAVAAGLTDVILSQANAALLGGEYRTARMLATSGLEEPVLDALMRSRLLVVRGLAHQAQGQQNEALVDFTIALQMDAFQGEERARALFARGLTLDAQARLDTAAGDYTAALAFAPNATWALNNRANVYRRQGRLVEARRDYVAALEAGTPNPQYPYFGLGQIAEAEGDMLAARNFYSRALIADPGFPLARDRLAALGAPAEGPADAEVIVLRPPPPKEGGPIVLRPPPAVQAMATSQASTPAVDPGPAPVAQTRASRSFPVPSPARGVRLRPPIVEDAASGPLVQLGAWRSEAEAREGWAVARASAGDLLTGLTPLIVTTVLPGRGTFYRLRVAAPGTAAAFCAALEDKGQACLPVPN